MQKIIITIVFVIFFHSISAQNKLFFTSYNWETKPNYTVKDTVQAIVAVKHKYLTEFYFQENGLVEYFLEHKIIWLNSDEKIEDYNKVYLPYSSNSELQVNKARVISKNGTIIELDDSKILTAQDEETGEHYKFFAFEGITKGSFIEYFYVVKRYPRYTGNRILFQTDFDKYQVDFDLYAPKNLIFKFKTYNTENQVVLDTLTKDKLHWQLKLPHLKALSQEEQAAYNASKCAVIYKLDKNIASNTKDISSYGKVAQNIYAYYYPELNKKTITSIKKFISKITNKADLDEETLIRKIESYIKSNIYLTEDNSDNFKDLHQIINKKIASESGVLKLYTNIFKYLNIKHEIVITSNRQHLKFDKSFEANNFLTDFLIYFNKNKTYLSPTDKDSRYGYPPGYLTDNYGLFIKEIKVGNFTSGVGKIKYIKPIKAEASSDKMIIDVHFDENDLNNVMVKLNKSMTGYYAMYFQPFTHLAKAEDIDKLLESFAKNINENITVTNKTMVNDNPELFGVKPFQMLIDFKTEALIEKAGRKYLFKVGELIGPQIQLYQEKKRILPLENEFKRSYYRTINITIPKGYKIANLDDINIDHKYIENGEELLMFKSFYEVNDEILTITADEHYKTNIIKSDIYEKYRTVINSAADFNKITLVLEPIK